MITQRTFEMPLVSTQISEKLSVAEPSLDVDVDKIYPISGFPRAIFSDEKIYECKDT